MKGGLFVKKFTVFLRFPIGTKYSLVTLEACSCEIDESIKDIGERIIVFKMFRDW